MRHPQPFGTLLQRFIAAPRFLYRTDFIFSASEAECRRGFYDVDAVARFHALDLRRLPASGEAYTASTQA